ncbi:threonine/serine exporter family protein [Sulfobacillus harzensis]|uniref:Threonine/serine exporter family protein n=1 Tax=Sulfobacillus harzensis TaxID=2729629 RepID=A0A7Y0L1J0_9FIRM|nr:threonine/serine exporter family protein [Sulfobacillus harzensis]NMP21041.1 threonine/serine exporter family protein [Sulfobacillus harzensis]
MNLTENRGRNPSPKVLKVIADAGMALLASGAEVSRVEDTMQRLATAYGFEAVEVIVLPTALFINAANFDTVIRRIRARSVNLAVVAQINQVSRDISQNPVPAEELERCLQEARHAARYRPEANLLFAGVGAAAISHLMGGTAVNFLPAFIAGALTQWVRQTLRHTGVAGGVADMVSAMTAVLPALFVAGVLHQPHPGAVLVGGIMVLTPGLLITTAVRDGIQGDLLSAAARILEALLSGAAIAAGASLPLYVYLAMGGRWV